MKLLQSIHNLDLSTFRWCLQCKNRSLMISISRWVSKSADGHLYAMIGFVLLALGEHHLLALVASAFIAERLLYMSLKQGFKRNRPPEAIPDYQSVIKPSDQFSFPSGHTSAAFLTTVLISALIPSITLFFLTWACLVGASRVILGVHFPTDTLAGALLGTSIALISLSVFGL